ncbi:hypothetical protein B0I28_108288 [Glycomyces artemisiae]|uniref:DUF3459 domain-containing protein n=1 Tax=Glycomyces artemisiae TaxID=1076443 RepID=A0A2T0UGN0_9ACTN|nr:hypothetical protein B0I28_108288 [Glycomyces artemisiae]
MLAFRRGGAFACAVNFSDAPIPLGLLGFDGAPLLASESLTDGVLAPDIAVWIA